MNTLSPVPAAPPGALVPADGPAAKLLKAFLSGRSKQTLRAYSADLRAFARWAGVATAEEAVRLLLEAGPGSANGAALAWRAAMQGEGKAAATVNRRLAALRSVTKLAGLLGMITWRLQ